MSYDSDSNTPRRGRSRLRSQTILRMSDIEQRRDPRYCEAPGCKKATAGKKPKCVNHVFQMPYVTGIKAKLEGQEVTNRLVKLYGSKAASVDDLTAREIIAHLKTHGPRTIYRITKEVCGGDKDLTEKYCLKLRQEDVIERGPDTQRGAHVFLIKETA